MNYSNLQDEFAQVSLEFANPFSAITANGAKKIRGFLESSTKFIEGKLKNIDTKHPNGLYVGAAEVDQAIRQKTVIYSDLRPVHVFVPPILRTSTKMLDYAQALRNDVLLSEKIVKNTPEEVESVINGYLGNPARLRDPMLINIPTAEGLSILDVTRAIEQNRKVNERLITATGTNSTRGFGEAYARVGDYTHTNEVAQELNDYFKVQIGSLKAFMDRVANTNSAGIKLLQKIESGEKEYEISGQVADHITSMLFRLATIVEYHGATVYNTQVFLKAVSDTNVTLQRVVK